LKKGQLEINQNAYLMQKLCSTEQHCKSY